MKKVIMYIFSNFYIDYSYYHERVSTFTINNAASIEKLKPSDLCIIVLS